MDLFQYGEKETEYLKRKDKKLGEAITRIGHVNRAVHPDLFEALVNSIVGQQISTKAQETIWKRFKEGFGVVTPEGILDCSDEKLQSFGISYRKVNYIKGAAKQIADKTLNLDMLCELSDEEVCKELVQLPGIGVWTAEMLMIFSMERPDILSFGDLAILRGMRMLYHHKTITKELFLQYRRRYSPYGTVASLYLWAIAGGAIPEWHDYGEQNK